MKNMQKKRGEYNKEAYQYRTAANRTGDVEPWHDPAFIAMMEALAESAEKELDLLLDF